MREVEFLPEWYPKVRKRKRMVALQAWSTLILIAGLGLWMILVQRNVRLRQHALGALQTDLFHSEEEINHLEEALKLQNQLSGKDQVLLKIGRSVEMTKLVSTLEQLMPADMALLDLNFDTEEAPHPGGTLAARAAAEQKATDSKLHFRLHGVAPTDVDLAEFLAKMTGKAFFKQVELMYSHERVENGHVMREFEVSFALELSQGSGATSPSVASAGGH
jgi:Tfp pilus assembly protein PilN